MNPAEENSFDCYTDPNKCFSCKFLRYIHISKYINFALETKKCENFSPLEPRSRVLFKKKHVKPKKLDVSFKRW